MPQDQYILRPVKVGDRREAELLADMWNRSDEGWPGGWTGGVPVTAERVLREDLRWDCYAQWVVEHAGEIVGFNALLAAAPEGALTAQSLPPIGLIQTLRPTRTLESAIGSHIFDMGQHFSC